MKIGYARVSTDEQNLGLQLDALAAAGCERIFKDEGLSGANGNRPGLASALRAIRPGDVLVVWKLDRLARSLPYLIEVLEDLGRRGVEFESVTERIDTTSPYGEFVFHLIGAVAQLERSLISERTRAGLMAARKRGQRLGRPPKLTAAQVAQAKEAIDAGLTTITELAALHGVAPLTVARAIKRAAIESKSAGG